MVSNVYLVLQRIVVDQDEIVVKLKSEVPHLRLKNKAKMHK